MEKFFPDTRTGSKDVRRLSCDTWDLECRQCRQTLLGDGI